MRVARSRTPPWSIVILSMALAGTIAWRTAPFVPAPPQARPQSAPAAVEPTPIVTPAALPPAEPTHTAIVEALVPNDAGDATIRATLTVTPTHAVVRLDGVVLTLPFSGALPRDDRLHELEASAPGHQTSRQLVGFDRDRQIDIALTRDEEPRRSRKKNRKVAGEPKEPRSAFTPPPADAPPEDSPAETSPAPPPTEPEPGTDLTTLPSTLRSSLDTTNPYREGH